MDGVTAPAVQVRGSNVFKCSLSDEQKKLVAAAVSASSVANIDLTVDYTDWRTKVDQLDPDMVFTQAFEGILLDHYLFAPSEQADFFLGIKECLQAGALKDQMLGMTQQAFHHIRIVAASSIIQPQGERSVLCDFARGYIETYPQHREFVHGVRYRYIAEMHCLIRNQTAKVAA